MSTAHEQISIIIPAFNAQEYLQRAVSSVLSQTYRELEIILVDDGSSDGTPAICDALAEKDSRIRVIHQENEGLSGARNTGMDQASSDYYMFLDADDEMLPEMAEKLWELLHETGADIAECAFLNAWTGPDGETRHAEEKRAPYRTRILTGDERFTHIWQMWAAACVQWNKLYKKHIFNHIRYPLGKIHEDEFVVHREMDAAEKVAVTDEQLYVHFLHKESITGTPLARNTVHAFEAFEDRVLFFCEKNREDLALGCVGQIMEYHASVRKRYRENGYMDGDEWMETAEVIYRRICGKIASLPGGKRRILRCWLYDCIIRMRRQLSEIKCRK